MHSLTLFEVAAEYRDMAERLADLDLDDQTIADTLEAEGGALVAKGTNVAFVVRNLEASAEAIKAAEQQMSARRKAIEARSKRLRDYLLDAMQLAGVSKIESPHFVLSVRANPPSVNVFDAAQVPADFMRQPEPPPAEPDKKRIAEALKAGQDVPGCALSRSHRIEIK
ncbi:siphovirus Gp157 family protein [Thiohalocapsa marina]|uniref:siphovirus Gp157 family protein n=1 Tax=Thiohalocapsa marina TaxID=424902 RepID=UPI0036DD4404